jgi:succinylarginine dihydrolase
MSRHAIESNLDGLVGPTHNYSGLSPGNLASESNRKAESSPRQAALQGLAKMKRLADLGYVQGVMPPHERPHIPTLRALGFGGDDRRILSDAASRAPEILAAAGSASAMWTANAATVSPSADTPDHRVHFTPANLAATFHRSIEPPVTGRLLKSIFPDETRFVHHAPLPGVTHFGDEGAANHTRLCAAHGEPGVELFVYGQIAFAPGRRAPTRFPARQTLEASRAVARLHGLTERRCVFARQDPAAIDGGVFHNDVIAVGNRNVLFYHEQAFLDETATLHTLQEKLGDTPLMAVRVSSDEVSLEQAVSSYLFNSQLLDRADGMLLAVPAECRAQPQVSRYLDRLLAEDNPIREVSVFDVKQSMQNGGGPACLRLRVPLTDQELMAMNRGILLDEALYERLVTWVQAHYRDRLSVADLADPMLLEESRKALDELTGILGLGSVYDFQL